MFNYKVPNKSINENIVIVKKQQESLNKKVSKKVGNEKGNTSEGGEDSTVLNYKSIDSVEETVPRDYSSYKKNKNLESVQEDLDRLSEQSDTSMVNEAQGEFDSFNIEQRKKNQVIKVPINDIMSYLSLKDKGKLLSISKELTKDDFLKFEEYLKYKNQKIGVRRALNILEEKLSKKEVDEVKEIFARYIDMTTVEEVK